MGIALGFVGWFWLMVGLVVWIGNGLGKDSGPAPFFDGPFIGFLVLWGGVFIGIAWAAFRCFKRALRPPRLDSASPAPEPARRDAPQSLATPDERLAHLVKKP